MCVTYQTPLPEVLVNSAPKPEEGADAIIEQSSENQAPTTSLSLGGVQNEDNTLAEKCNGDKIITLTSDLLPHDPILEYFVKDVLAAHPQAKGEEPGEAKELVEDTPCNSGKIENIY